GAERAGAVCHRVGSWLRWRGMWARIVPAQEASKRESRYGSGLDPARAAAALFMLDASNIPARAPVGAVALGLVHKRRLREVYRSAGWPCQDGIETELLAAGLLQRERGPLGHETIRLTDAGIAVLAESLAKNRARRDAHELLVERVAREMTRAGRLAWRGLAVRALVDAGWTMAMPDVL